MTVLPVRSTRTAPAGTCSSPRRPTRVNCVFSTMNAEFSMGALPSPVMRRAPSNTVAPAWPSSGATRATRIRHDTASRYNTAFVTRRMTASWLMRSRYIWPSTQRVAQNEPNDKAHLAKPSRASCRLCHRRWQGGSRLDLRASRIAKATLYRCGTFSGMRVQNGRHYCDHCACHAATPLTMPGVGWFSHCAPAGVFSVHSAIVIAIA